MENFGFYSVCIVIALTALLFVAEPHRLLPELEHKKKRVG